MSGKSKSIAGLDPETTLVVQGINRSLPKSNSGKLFKKVVITDVDKLGPILKKINDETKIKSLVLDDFHYIFGNEFAKSAKTKGYDKYNDYFVDYHTLFNGLVKLREDLFIHVLWHSEPVYSGNKIVKYEPKFIGAATKKYYNPLGLADIITYAKPEFDGDGKAEYGLYTKNFQDEDGIEYQARSLEEMFEETRIPNDLGLVEKKYHNYYKTEEKV